MKERKGIQSQVLKWENYNKYKSTYKIMKCQICDTITIKTLQNVNLIMSLHCWKISQEFPHSLQHEESNLLSIVRKHFYSFCYSLPNSMIYYAYYLNFPFIIFSHFFRRSNLISRLPWSFHLNTSPYLCSCGTIPLRWRSSSPISIKLFKSHLKWHFPSEASQEPPMPPLSVQIS